MLKVTSELHFSFVLNVTFKSGYLNRESLRISHNNLTTIYRNGYSIPPCGEGHLVVTLCLLNIQLKYSSVACEQNVL